MKDSQERQPERAYMLAFLVQYVYILYKECQLCC